MRVACCCDGDGSVELVERVLGRVGPIRALLLVHCIDLGPDRDVHLIQERLLGRQHIAERHQQAMTASEEARAAEILGDAAAEAVQTGFGGTIESQVLHGRPEREIVHWLETTAADAVALYPRPPARQSPAGPRSIGHVARYIVDHAPCDVLLLRGPGPWRLR